MIKHPKNTAEFESYIKEGLVLVDFFTTWCGPCKMIAPILEEIDEENQNISIVKVDAEELSEVSMRFAIQAVPTLILFKDGKVIDKTMGYQSKDALLEFISK